MIFLRLSGKEKGRHLFTWLLILTYSFVSAPKTDHWFIQFIGCVFSVLNYSILYYATLCILLPNLWKDRKFLLIPCLLGLFCLYFTIKWYIGDYLIYFAHVKSSPGRFQRYLSISGLFFAQITFIAFTTYFNRLAMEKLRRETERGMHILYQELDFLKNQFNSHLTYNFLNFVYGKVLESSDRAAEAITLFSETLRYSLGIRSQKPIPIQSEMENISNVVDLQKCLKSDCYVNVSMLGDFNQILIYPRILISIIENAFRYGISGEADSPIEITLSNIQEQICFDVKYKLNHLKEAGEDNLDRGLEKYLTLYYKDQYSLRMQKHSDYYSVNLSLKPL
jgi:two-component system LytT family sensor kinase